MIKIKGIPCRGNGDMLGFKGRSYLKTGKRKRARDSTIVHCSFPFVLPSTQLLCSLLHLFLFIFYPSWNGVPSSYLVQSSIFNTFHFYRKSRPYFTNYFKHSCNRCSKVLLYFMSLVPFVII